MKTVKRAIRWVVAVAALQLTTNALRAQDTLRPTIRPVVETDLPRHQLFIGTQVPLQYTAGYAYRFSRRLSARAQVGVLTKPYDQLIVRLMESFGLEKSLGRVIEKSFQSGTLLGLGVNYHAGKNYVGLYGQYVRLQAGGITPADGLGVYFRQDFSGFNPFGLPAFEFSMQSNLFNLGVLYGRQFQLRNPRWRIDGEVGVAKVMGSSNSFTSNRALINSTGLARGLYQQLDQQVGDSYLKYGWLPSVSVYLVYQFR